MKQTIKTKIIGLFELFGYEFIEESPDDRLLFYDPETESNVQFWVHKERPVSKAVELIKGRIEQRAENWAKCKMQRELRELIGIKPTE